MRRLWPLWIAIALAIVVFSGALRGGFLYDDKKQILQNDLVKENRYLLRALTTDTWSFTTTSDAPASNYWRPLFALWLIVNYRLFGTATTLGWHLTSLGLHLAVLAAAYLLLRRLKFPPTQIAVILGVFAVHPAHVESVAWIIGFPDPLLALLFLLALDRALALREEQRPSRWAAAIGLFALALLTKELAVVFPVVLAVWLFVLDDGDLRSRVRSALRFSTPFFLVAFLWLAVRARVLGGLHVEHPWRFGAAEILLTAPSLLAFYLRQAVLPFHMAVSHGMRVVTAFGLSAFVVPLAFVLAGATALVLMARRDKARMAGLALWSIPLILPLNVNELSPDDLAHDRYIYLALLGLLMVVVPACDGFLRTAPRPARAAALALLGVYGICLLVTATRYALAWTSEEQLWAWNAAANPGSAPALTEHARALVRAGRLEEARPVLDRALSLRGSSDTFMVRGRLNATQERYPEAEQDLVAAIKRDPGNETAYEWLAITYQRLRRWSDAERVLRAARARFPGSTCAFTDALASVLHEAGRADESLAELERVRPRVDAELGAPAKGVLFHLGLGYLERSRPAEAKAALSDYLSATANHDDADTLRRRARTAELLSRLPSSALGSPAR